MAPLRTARVSKLPRAEQWASQICTELGKTVESILEVGHLLLKAKADLIHGEWGRMFEDKLIPLTQNTASRYMAVASHPVLSNSAHAHTLPPAWVTLYELTKVPDPVLKHALQDGLITPEMERKHVKALLPPRETPMDVAADPPHEPAPRSSSRDLYRRLEDVLADFDDLAAEEQGEFLTWMAQALARVQATVGLVDAASRV